MASTFDADAHVDTGEAVAAEEEDRFVGLVAEDFRLDELDRGAIYLYQAAAALAVGHGDGVLLTAEALHGFHCERRGIWDLKSRMKMSGIYPQNPNRESENYPQNQLTKSGPSLSLSLYHKAHPSLSLSRHSTQSLPP